jgi:peroxiredoxin
MVALAPGTKAPRFRLKALTADHPSLESALKDNAAVVLAFFKVSCPICQLTFPYLERLHRSYRQIPLWGVSQDDADQTSAFARMYGCSFPMVLDDDLSTTVAYDLTNVPSIFLVLPDGSIGQTTVGFVKADLEELNQQMARLAGSQLKPLFTSADEVPVLQPG